VNGSLRELMDIGDAKLSVDATSKRIFKPLKFGEVVDLASSDEQKVSLAEACFQSKDGSPRWYLIESDKESVMKTHFSFTSYVIQVQVSVVKTGFVMVITHIDSLIESVYKTM
jgi:hypothetical protein